VVRTDSNRGAREVVFKTVHRKGYNRNEDGSDGQSTQVEPSGMYRLEQRCKESRLQNCKPKREHQRQKGTTKMKVQPSFTAESEPRTVLVNRSNRGAANFEKRCRVVRIEVLSGSNRGAESVDSILWQIQQNNMVD